MNSLIENIYHHSPISLQQWMVAIYGWQWYHQRYGGRFPFIYQQFRERDSWSANQFHEYQEDRLNKLFQAAWNSVYYRKVFRDIGLPKRIISLEALRNIPLLSKEVVRNHSRELLTQNPPKGSKTFNTSGTTGTPISIYYSSDFHSLELAVPAVRNFGWAGVDYKARRVMFGVRKVCRFEQDHPPFWRFSPAEDMAYASIYHLSPLYIPAYLSFLREYRPAVIMGYPSALRVIAQYALENNDLPAPAQGVFTTSEVVTEQDRALIEAAWQCKIFDRYGAVENCVFVCQCEYGRYHVSPDVGILEIVNSSGEAVPPGVMGEVVCTGLHNMLQPLIRYRIGDVARWSENQTCPCKREMPIIEAIEGRLIDICYTLDRRQILRFGPVFKEITNIREAQVVQEELNYFIVKVLPSKDFNHNDITNIIKNMRAHVGDVRIDVLPVDYIPRTSAGKFRAVICNLPRELKEALRQDIR